MGHSPVTHHTTQEPQTHRFSTPIPHLWPSARAPFPHHPAQLGPKQHCVGSHNGIDSGQKKASADSWTPSENHCLGDAHQGDIQDPEDLHLGDACQGDTQELENLRLGGTCRGDTQDPENHYLGDVHLGTTQDGISCHRPVCPPQVDQKATIGTVVSPQLVGGVHSMSASTKRPATSSQVALIKVQAKKHCQSMHILQINGNGTPDNKTQEKSTQDDSMDTDEDQQLSETYTNKARPTPE